MSQSDPDPLRIGMHPRMPRVHNPCLVAVALWGLFEVVSPFLPSSDNVIDAVQLLLVGAALTLHTVWLYTLYRNGKQLLGDKLPLDATRAILVLLLSCFFIELWTVTALGIILKTTQERAEKLDAATGRVLARFAAEIRTLFIMAVLNLMVSMGFLFVYLSFAKDRALDSVGGIAPISAFGLGGVTVMAFFQLTVNGYYLYFVCRATPALYRGYAVIESSSNS